MKIVGVPWNPAIQYSLQNTWTICRFTVVGIVSKNRCYGAFNFRLHWHRYNDYIWLLLHFKKKIIEHWKNFHYYLPTYIYLTFVLLRVFPTRLGFVRFYIGQQQSIFYTKILVKPVLLVALLLTSDTLISFSNIAIALKRVRCTPVNS